MKIKTKKFQIKIPLKFCQKSFSNIVGPTCSNTRILDRSRLSHDLDKVIESIVI